MKGPIYSNTSGGRDWVAEFRQTYVESAGSLFDSRVQRWGESPIESMVIASALSDGWVYPEQHGWCHALARFKEAGGQAHKILWRHDALFCVAFQVGVVADHRQFRLDISACSLFDKIVKVAVELDGHDYHERTKAQARHDKSRDRALTQSGWLNLRFTGSEIYEDPSRVLEELHNLFEGQEGSE